MNFSQQEIQNQQMIVVDRSKLKSMFLIFQIIQTFDVIDLFRGDWNIEEFDITPNGQAINKKKYFVNLTDSGESYTLNGSIYEGEIMRLDDSRFAQMESIFDLEIFFSTTVNGTLSISKGPASSLSEEHFPFDYNFSFKPSFQNFLYLAGKVYYDDKLCTFMLNIINRATIHMTVMSSSENINKELIFTRGLREETDPWYQKHNKILNVILAFVVTTIFLRLFDTKIQKCFKNEDIKTRQMYDAAKKYFAKEKTK